MIQAIVKKGIVIGEQVPAPVISADGVLIKVVNSCISAGTEMTGVQNSGKPIIKRMMEQPEKLKKVIDMTLSDGIQKTLAQVKGLLDLGTPTGYSISGIVIGVGKNINTFKAGDRVAAAGGGYANHAEYVDVPENLVVHLPEAIDFVSASTVTLGAIAMHGVRRADLRFGEFAVVVGSGILGLLAIQMLKVAGVRIACTDIDNNRLKIAKDLGAEIVFNPLESNVVNEITNWADGYGADAVLFTAATNNSEPLSDAFKMCRRKGKVVLVGVSGMHIKRADIYPKEIDFLISTSYGPGRYDKNYEENGIDYPYAYVRWSENRNLKEYIRLINDNLIHLDRIINKIYPVADITDAFNSLNNPEEKPLMVILDYGEPDTTKLDEYLNHDRKVFVSEAENTDKKKVNVALVGLGSFATNVHIPNLNALKDKFNIAAVVNKTGNKATHYAKHNNAVYATTNYNDVLSDENIDLVFISTRHDTHAQFVLQALQAGKHVFVEKPLATNWEELKAIEEFYQNSEKKPLLMVGFNRRFSKYAKEIKKHTSNRINPMIIRYRMNAGYIPLDHWVHENGGRIVGEACHIIDLMTFFTESQIESISYETMAPNTNHFSATDNKSIILKYNDGSIATIEYFANGSKDLPKEQMEIHYDQKSIVMEDYKNLKGYNVKLNEISSPNSQKGHIEELHELYATLTSPEAHWPIAYWDMIQTTKTTLLIK
jgi:predicted dehydrogenase/threonine dehydrogenase-like Zn-dependent dehydrogenase